MKAFDEARLAIPKFAEKVHPYFVSNNWTYSDTFTEYLPTVDDIKNVLNDLLTSVMIEHFKGTRHMRSSSGRLCVVLTETAICFELVPVYETFLDAGCLEDWCEPRP